MKRSAVFAFVLLLSIPGGAGGVEATRGATGPARVRMLDEPWDRFRPVHVTIRRGQRVVWVNVGAVTHTATGEGWDSGNVAPGRSWAKRFRQRGEFGYRCVIHPEMTGTVIVE
jgi:plastocyanin